MSQPPTVAEHVALIVDRYIHVDGLVAYMSGPLTSGPLATLAAQHAHLFGGSRKAATAVLAINSDLMRDNARRILAEGQCAATLNPAEWSVPGWTPDEYAECWQQVLRALRPDVVLTPGWSRSGGCRAEVWDALALDLHLFELQVDGRVQLSHSTLVRRTLAETRADERPVTVVV